MTPSPAPARIAAMARPCASPRPWLPWRSLGPLLWLGIVGPCGANTALFVISFHQRFCLAFLRFFESMRSNRPHANHENIPKLWKQKYDPRYTLPGPTTIIHKKYENMSSKAWPCSSWLQVSASWILMAGSGRHLVDGSWLSAPTVQRSAHSGAHSNRSVGIFISHDTR